MKITFGQLVSLQAYLLSLILVVVVLLDAWPSTLFWVAIVGVFLAIDAGLLLRLHADRRSRS